MPDADGEDAVLASGVRVTPSSVGAGSALEVVTVRLSGDDLDPARSWLVEPAWIIVERCQRAHARCACTRLAVVLVLAEPRGPAQVAIAAAAVAGVRALVHALTLEVGERMALNLVVVDRASERQAEDTLSFLASGGADWIQGATFDLREDGWRSS